MISWKYSKEYIYHDVYAKLQSKEPYYAYSATYFESPVISLFFTETNFFLLCQWIQIKFYPKSLIGWLVILRIYIALALFQPYRDLEAGDNQSLIFKWWDRESNPDLLLRKPRA